MTLGAKLGQYINVLAKGEIIEECIDDKPFPNALIVGFVNKRPLHVVVALRQFRTSYRYEVEISLPSASFPQ